jgi:DNA mismatch repair protein MutS2
MVGLLQLMVQAGLQIPVEEGSEMGIFKEVLADIGDEQDITQGLSSFSSHIKNLVRIIERVNPQSICLLDELGSDTNPSEGAALGIAVLEYILKKGAFCIITTHHNALKAYASIHQDQVVNASMGFDPEQMMPTYALHTGYPGSSNAFDTCVRLELPSEILERAKEVLGEGEVKLDNLLYRLNQEETLIREERIKQERLSSELELIKKRYAILKEKVEERESRIAREAQIKVKEIVEMARKEIEGLMQEVKKKPPTSREIKMITNDLKNVTERMIPPSPKKTIIKKGVDIEKIAVGQQVFIVDFNEQGIVSQIDRRDKKVWVMIGHLKLQVEANDLAPVDLKTQTAETKKNIPTVITQLSKEEINPTLMVIGQRAEDALLEIDKYIDNAVLAHLTHVSIIHGKGTGALKEAIEKFLTSHPQVAQFRSGSSQEGGTGVTIVDLAV